MKGIEFGRSGVEGLKDEGADETKGYGSLGQEVPFAGENMTEQADRINAILESIDLPEFEDGQDVQPETGIKNDGVGQEAKNLHDDTQSQIESLKANIHAIFDSNSNSTSAQVPDYDSKPVAPRTPPVEAVANVNGDPFYPANYGDKEPENNQISQPEKTDAEKEQIKKELAEAKIQLAKTLEWAKQQPNEPEKTFSGNLDNLPDDAKRRIMERMEAMQQGDVIISKIDNVYQEGNTIVVDAKDNQGRFTGAEFTVDDFAKLVNNPPQEQLSSLTGQFDDSKEHAQDSPEQDEDQLQPEQLVTQEQKLQETLVEQEKSLAPEADTSAETDDPSIKRKTINQIVSKMLDAGEFQNYGLDISQKMRDIEYAKKKLQDKTLEELRILLSTYE